MVRRKKAKANAPRSRFRRKDNAADVKAKVEASASSQVMTGATVEDGVELLNNEEDVGEVGGIEDIEAEDSAGEENVNEQMLEQGSGVIATDSMNCEDHGKIDVVNENCFVENIENIAMEIMNCDKYDNKVGIDKAIEVEQLNMDNEVVKWLVTPNQENEVKVLAEENVVAGCLGERNTTEIVGDYVGEINEENTVSEENCGGYANIDEERIADDIKQEGEEEEEEEYKEVEEEGEEGEEENIQSDEVDEEEDMVDDEEDMVDDEVDGIHLEEEIHINISDKHGDEDVLENGNCQGGAKEQDLEGEEVMVEAGVNNIKNEVEETPDAVDIDGKASVGNGDKKVVAGKVNYEGVFNERKEVEVEKIKNQKITRSRKRIKTSTIMVRSAGKLALEIHDEPKCSHKENFKQGVDEDLKEQKNCGEGVPKIDNDTTNVAYGNKGKQKVGVDLKDSGGEKVQLNTEKEVGESSKKKRKRLKQKSRSDPLVEGSLVKVASESDDKSGFSGKKKGLSKAATKGMIFMCSSKTKQDCYRYMVLGLPAGKRELVEKIHKGMILFLYDVDKKLLNGIYKAAANGGYDLEPKAFNSKFPAQVRFEILEGCLPLEEEKFSEVIRDNYYTRSKFDCQLSSGQVENLCELFRASIKDVKSERKRSRRAVKSAIKQRQQEREKGKAKVKEAQAKFLAKGHEVRRPPPRKERHHHKHPLVLDEVASFPRQPVRLSQASTSSYAYERPLRREAYRGEPSVPHHEIYREQQLLEPRDTYRRELLLGRRDTYSPDPYLEHRGTSRQERMLVPGDLYRVEQPPLQHRDSYRQYPALERRDYNLKPLVEHRDYDLEPLAERRDSYLRQGLILDRQDFYRKDPELELQNRQLDLEPRHSSIRRREDVLLSRQEYSAYSDGVYSTVQHLDMEPRLSNRRGGEDVLLSREDHSAYSGGLYSTARPVRASIVSASRAVGLTTVYPSSEAEPRYYSHRPVYRP